MAHTMKQLAEDTLDYIESALREGDEATRTSYELGLYRGALQVLAARMEAVIAGNDAWISGGKDEKGQ